MVREILRKVFGVRRLGKGLLIGFSVILVSLVLAPELLDRYHNRVLNLGIKRVPVEAKGLHGSLTVADLHADTLLWSRDFLKRVGYGHIDLPRLREGNVALQVFSVVTKSPRNRNYKSNPSDSDILMPGLILSGWPPRTWSSLLQRALFQSERLQRMVKKSGGDLRLVRNVNDLQSLLALREEKRGSVGALLAIEGAHCLEGKIENIDELFKEGYRMIGLAHFFDNEVGGSAHGVVKNGLTEFGRMVVRQLEERRMIIDLAHSSPRVYEEVLRMATRPIVVSHGGVKGTCDSVRNLGDEILRKIAGQGGLIGIGYWDGAICDPTPSSWARAVEYAITIMGEDHVALGSDFDGAVAVAFDTSELSLLTAELIALGMKEKTIRKIMGENVVRFLRKNLPLEEVKNEH